MKRTYSVAIQDVKEINRLNVLNTIHEEKEISRTDIAKKLHLSLPAVSRIIKKLEDDEYVMTCGYGDSSGGRKPIMIRPNPNAGYFLSIDCAHSKIRYAIFSFAGEMTVTGELLAAEKDYMQCIFEVCELGYEAIENKEKLLGISLGIRGLLDFEKGIILSSREFKEKKVPLRSILEEKYQVPVLINVSARYAALAEWKMTQKQAFHDLIYITTNWGIGAGIIREDNIFCGSRGTAGEIGEMLMPAEDGAFCSLEYLCGSGLLIRETQKNWEDSSCDYIKGKIAHPDQMTPDIIKEGVIEQDPLSIQIAQKAGRYLGSGIVSLINVFNPEAVVIGGAMSEFGSPYFDSIREVLHTYMPVELAENVVIEQAGLGSEAALYGGSIALFQMAFGSELEMGKQGTVIQL